MNEKHNPSPYTHVTGLDQVEKVAASIWHEGYGQYRPPGKDEWPDGVIGGSQDLFRAMARAAIAAASPQPNPEGDVDALAAAFQDGFTSGNGVWSETPEHHREMFREGIRSLLAAYPAPQSREVGND